MVDHISPERRSWLMSRVRGKHTTPEMRVRRLAHSMGLRFRLHRRDLPGKPDLVLPPGLQGWEFKPKSWSDIVEISAPDLSLREKVEIDKHLKKGPSAILKAIKFKPTSELDDARIAIASYKRLHRYYPSFYAIGIQ